MSDTVELKKTVPVVAAEEKVPEKGLTEDSFVYCRIWITIGYVADEAGSLNTHPLDRLLEISSRSSFLPLLLARRFWISVSSKSSAVEGHGGTDGIGVIN